MDQGAAIVVMNRQEWYGNQSLGAFQVTVDGTKVGPVFPLKSLRVACDPGRHTVRIRQWWYRSSPVEVTVAGGEELRLVADGPTGRHVLGRMAGLALRPSRSLSLSVDST